MLFSNVNQTHRRNKYCSYIYAQLAQCLKTYISVFIGLFSKVVVFIHQQSDQSFYRSTPFHFILQSDLNHNHLTSTKKQISSLCKIAKRKLNLYSTVRVNFSLLLMKPTKYRKVCYTNLNLRLDLQKQKTNCSLILTRI